MVLCWSRMHMHLSSKLKTKSLKFEFGNFFFDFSTGWTSSSITMWMLNFHYCLLMNLKLGGRWRQFNFVLNKCIWRIVKFKFIKIITIFLFVQWIFLDLWILDIIVSLCFCLSFPWFCCELVFWFYIVWCLWITSHQQVFNRIPYPIIMKRLKAMVKY